MSLTAALHAVPRDQQTPNGSGVYVLPKNIGRQWVRGLAALRAATPSTSLLVRDGDMSGYYRLYSLSAGLAAGSLTLH